MRGLALIGLRIRARNKVQERLFVRELRGHDPSKKITDLRGLLRQTESPLRQIGLQSLLILQIPHHPFPMIFPRLEVEFRLFCRPPQV